MMNLLKLSNVFSMRSFFNRALDCPPAAALFLKPVSTFRRNALTLSYSVARENGAQEKTGLYF